MYVIGTAGPKVKEKKVLKGIVTNGVNVLRLNFAHGSTAEFKKFIKDAKDIDKSILIMIDLCGAKIRVSNKLQNIYKIYDDEEVYFCGEDVYSKSKAENMKKKLIPLNVEHRRLIKEKYSKISIKDNTMIFKVMKIENGFIKAVTEHGGIVRGGKGCNIKGFTNESLDLTHNDKKAILWGIENNVDIIAHSFTENKKQIDILKKFISDNDKSNRKISVWGKIETLRGVLNVDEIVSNVDGIILGRGDLIPETSLEDAPIYEEAVIKKAKEKNKDVVIATHILESMQRGIRPTICEAESIYGFIKAGVTGFLLAGETSVGKAPIRTVEFLSNLIRRYTN